MKKYHIKARPGKAEFLEIISETDEGYNIKHTKIRDGDIKVKEDFINRHLFDICLKTGYLFELASADFNALTA